MADIGPPLGGGGVTPSTDDLSPIIKGFSFTNLVNALVTISRNLAGIQQAITNSFINLSGNNIFSGTNTFKLPPIINAGAVGTGSFKPEGVLSAQVPPGGSGNGADGTEDTLFTYSLPATSLDVAGRGVTVFAFGKLAANGDTKTTKVYFGSTSFSSGGLTSSGVSWWLQATFFKSAANSQVGIFTGQFGSTMLSPTTTATTETDTGAIVLKCTGQSGSSAANDVLAYGMIVTYSN